tara:strand:- start:3606 stop:3866 length:261 start_codon:yes stop_codon:yes gene_type:complete
MTIGKIMKNVPLQSKRKPKYNFPLETMEVGEALIVHETELVRSVVKELPIIRQYVYRKAEQEGKTYSVRKYNEKGFGIGIGIWRLT